MQIQQARQPVGRVGTTAVASRTWAGGPPAHRGRVGTIRVRRGRPRRRSGGLEGDRHGIPVRDEIGGTTREHRRSSCRWWTKEAIAWGIARHAGHSLGVVRCDLIGGEVTGDLSPTRPGLYRLTARLRGGYWSESPRIVPPSPHRGDSLANRPASTWLSGIAREHQVPGGGVRRGRAADGRRAGTGGAETGDKRVGILVAWRPPLEFTCGPLQRCCWRGSGLRNRALFLGSSKLHEQLTRTPSNIHCSGRTLGRPWVLVHSHLKAYIVRRTPDSETSVRRVHASPHLSAVYGLTNHLTTGQGSPPLTLKKSGSV